MQEFEARPPFRHYVAAAVGYTVFALVGLVILLMVGEKALTVVAPDFLARRRASLPPAPAVYTREECAKVWSQGSLHLFGVGDVPVQPFMEQVDQISKMLEAGHSAEEILRTNIFKAPGVEHHPAGKERHD